MWLGNLIGHDRFESESGDASVAGLRGMEHVLEMLRHSEDSNLLDAANSRRLAERDLREASARFRRLAEQVPPTRLTVSQRQQSRLDELLSDVSDAGGGRPSNLQDVVLSAASSLERIGATVSRATFEGDVATDFPRGATAARELARGLLSAIALSEISAMSGRPDLTDGDEPGWLST